MRRSLLLAIVVALVCVGCSSEGDEARPARSTVASTVEPVGRVYRGIDPIVTAVLTMMSTFSSVSEHPEINPADYFTSEALAASSVFESGCLDEITAALTPIAIDGAFIADPRTTEPAMDLLEENDVGSVAVENVPVLLASGTADLVTTWIEARLAGSAPVDTWAADAP